MARFRKRLTEHPCSCWASGKLAERRSPFWTCPLLCGAHSAPSSNALGSSAQCPTAVQTDLGCTITSKTASPANSHTVLYTKLDAKVKPVILGTSY